MARNYTALPHEYRTTMSMLTDAEFGRLIRWLLEYSATGTLASLGGREAILCPTVQLREDQFQASFEEVDKVRSESARKAANIRWGKREDADACEGMPTDAPDTNTKTKTKGKTITKTNISPSDDGRDKSAPRFVPPSAQEVHAYARERQSRVDPERFLDYYAAKGWIIGGSMMEDWRAAFRNWERDERQRGQNAPPPPPKEDPEEIERKNAEDLRKMELLLERMERGDLRE